ncbi:HDOD domain-containing protein [Shewanella sp. D64]|uniref:HDOD domain-containing protein n=1 Tax=unclassified Shewanella TaxID=196818 RepID=UPI0022BA57CA|nr:MULTISPECIES: HDOD domain-containing protein [unclassified Shewanella]MEC4727155.1 HDOD domain-containing protein [Shewanella sp. D64]MEC4739228.1 HDOD domain-containing protein [Shewanella sp. E94]WBJ95568.1 HDOD domain-containing protein [Shewanella sp. MTB7]
MVKKIIQKIFNVRDKANVDEAKSSAIDPSFQNIASVSQKPVQSSMNPPKQNVVAEPVTVDLCALFYGLLFPSQGCDDGKIANNLENTVISDVENALIWPENIAQKVLKLPSQLAVLDQKLRDDSVDINTVLEVFKTKPLLSIEVLKLCNSPAFKRSDKEVTSLQQAFVQLGREQIRRLVMTCFMGELGDIKPIYYRRFGSQIWRHSKQVSYLSGELCQNDPDTAFMLGLLHDVGKIAIFKMLLDAFHQAEPGEQPKSSLFKQVMTTKSLSLSTSLAKYWNLPEIFESSLSQLANSDTKPSASLSLAVWRANLISECSMLFEVNQLQDECLNKLLIDADITREQFDIYHEKLKDF